MTTYAPAPAFAERKNAPRALSLIVAGHAALMAAVMSEDGPAGALDPPETVIELGCRRRIRRRRGPSRRAEKPRPPIASTGCRDRADPADNARRSIRRR